MNGFATAWKSALVFSACAVLMLLAGCGGGGPSDGTPGDPTKPLSEYNRMFNLFGDPHVHTNLSDGDESPDFAIRYARDTVGLDWCAMLDHVEYLVEDGASIADYYRSLPKKYDEPGRFCVIFAYEWTSLRYGHRSVYSSDSSMPFFPCDRPESDTIEELWKVLEGYDVITAPHHPIMDSTYSWTATSNPGVECAVEFYSKWGNSISPEEDRQCPNVKSVNSVVNGLVNEGLRYGLIAGTDTHMSRPASRLEECRQPGAIDYAQPGITGVWATAFTGAAIYNAIKNRHTYGMTGTRVSLKFSVNSHIMGSEISSAVAPVITFKVSSPIQVSRVIILKISNQSINELKAYSPNALELQGSYTDTDFLEDSAYLLRVELANTDMALCTPVWVAYAGTNNPT
jgi:hypothetical protein